MFHSPVWWKTAIQVQKEFSKLESKTARLEATKEQIRMRVIGFGWNNLHHAWSKDVCEYTPEELQDHLIKEIIPQQQKRGIPDKPTMDLPSRKATKQLGRRTADVDDLDKRYESEKSAVIVKGTKLRDNLEARGVTDRYEKLQ